MDRKKLRVGRKRDAESTSGKSAGRIEILAASGDWCRINRKSFSIYWNYFFIICLENRSGQCDGIWRKEGIGLGLSERGDYALWQTSEEEIVKAVKVLVSISRVNHFAD